MKKFLKWIGIVLGSLIALLLLVALGLYTKSRLDFAKKFSVQVELVTVPADSAAVAHGQHLATILCMECHGKDLGGDLKFFDAGPLGSAVTPNLTAGKGGAAAEFSDEDFVRLVRHGVTPEETSVFLMPSQDFYHLSDKDLGDLIAYIRSVPPVDRETSDPHFRFTFLGNVMYGAGIFGNLQRAGKIDQANRPPAPPDPAVTAEYGQYLVNINGCHDCHGAQLAGGKTGDPGSPLAPNLTPFGELSAWSEAPFITTLRTGVTPDGKQLPDRFMPWNFRGKMTDDELKAVWAYLQSLPSLPSSTAPAE